MQAHNFVITIMNLLAVGFLPAFAGTEATPSPNQLYGHISTDRVLTPPVGGGPIEIIGDLTIDSGATLTLARGVRVRVAPFADYLASGSDRERVEILVHGSLVVPPGADSVVMGSDGSSASWGGITIENGGVLTLNDVHLSDCSIINCRTSSLVEIRRSRIATGVSVGAGLVTVQRTSFVAGSLALLGNSRGTVENSSFEGSGIGIETSEFVSLRACSTQTGGISCTGTGRTLIEDCFLRGAGIGYFNGIGHQIARLTVEDAPYGLLLQDATVEVLVDSVAPRPVELRRCSIGIEMVGGIGPSQNLYFRNVLMSRCWRGVAIYSPGGQDFDVTLNHCTIVDCDYGAINASSGIIRVINSIVAYLGRNNLFSGPVAGYWGGNYQLARSDSWGYARYGAITYSSSHISFGEGVSTFDPFLLGESDGYRLSPVSFFSNASSSGGQLGAYGPGAVGPTPVASASVVAASGVGGCARVKWYCPDQAGRRLPIVRRDASMEWIPVEALLVNEQGFVELMDRNVEELATYDYAVGVSRAGYVDLDAMTTVTIEAVTRSIGALSAYPNPAGSAWSVSFVAAAAKPVTIDVVDLQGRRCYTTTLQNPVEGRLELKIPSTGLQSGIYWLIARQAGKTERTRVVLSR